MRQWRELGLAFDAALCALTRVKLLGGSPPETRAAAADARAFFEHVGAESFLKQLTDAEQTSPSATLGRDTRVGEATQSTDSTAALER